jgi:hypothetical protein
VVVDHSQLKHVVALNLLKHFAVLANGKKAPFSLACHTPELEHVPGPTKDCLFSSFSARFVAPLKGLELEWECIEEGLVIA